VHPLQCEVIQQRAWQPGKGAPYLFVDGIAERLRPGGKREPVLAAWGYTIEGRRILLHLMAGSKEDAETVTALFEDMKLRGLNDPLLITSDGAPGIVKAIEVCFPHAARQRCLAHRMRNLASKVPEEVWPEFKARVQAAYQAPSRAIARELRARPPTSASSSSKKQRNGAG
jgi:putative transposase